MGRIKDSVAWRSEWQERFCALQEASDEKVGEFIQWWNMGLEEVFKARFEAFPLDAEDVLGYLQSLKKRWIVREIRQCAANSAPPESWLWIIQFVDGAFSRCIEVVAGSQHAAGRVTKRELLEGVLQRRTEQN